MSEALVLMLPDMSPEKNKKTTTTSKKQQLKKISSMA